MLVEAKATIMLRNMPNKTSTEARGVRLQYIAVTRSRTDRARRLEAELSSTTRVTVFQRVHDASLMS